MCLEGDFSSALIGFLPTVDAPASRFTPQLFLIYFYIFKTATAPHCIIASHPFHLCRSDAVWEPIKGPWVYSLCFFLIQMQILTVKLCRCCPSEAWIVGEVCPQGSQMLPCCLRWCRWMLSCLNPEAFKSLLLHASRSACFVVLIASHKCPLQSQCWTSLLTVVNSPGASGIALPAPSPKFLLVCSCLRLEIQIFYFDNLPSF